MQARIALGGRRPGGEISPFIYGHFIEFIRDGISAMRAEVLRNRSFEQAGARPHLAAEWEPLAGEVLRVGGEAGGGPSPAALRLGTAPGAPAAVRQSGLYLRPGQRYQGTAWVWAPRGDVTLRVRLCAADGRALAEATLPVPREPRRVAFALAPVGGDAAAALLLTAAGAGAVCLDQLSLLAADAMDGWRRDVLDLIRPLRPSVLRFPGGCFADAYHWRDGVGERDRRPPRFNHAWKHVGPALEENTVGTAEFIALCRHLGCEPLLTVNFGSAEPAEAAAWVEYCNGDATTPMGRLRTAHGFPQPFAVRFWEVGNEPWGHWEVGCCDAAGYAERYLRFRAAMRAADPSIQILATGSNANSTDQAWNAAVADRVGEAMEFLTLHYYAPQLAPEESLLPAAQVALGTAAAALKLEESLAGAAAVLDDRTLTGRVRLAVTEWNTMYTDESGRELTLGAAVANATFLNLFLRQAASVGMAHFSDLVNGWEGGLIRSEPAGAYGTPTYHVFRLYAGHGGRHSLELAVQAPTLPVPALGHLPARAAVPVLDAAATESDDGRSRWLFAVNRSPDAALELAVAPGWEPAAAQAELVGGSDPEVRNDLLQPERVAARPHPVAAEGGMLRLVLPPQAVVRLALHRP